MKPGIHPNYVDCTVTCSCGNSFQTKSTRSSLRTDLCNVCHPFYTGEQRIVDTAGQVERFMKKMENAATSAAKPSKRQQRLATRAAEVEAQKRRPDVEEPAAEVEPETTVADA